MHFLHSIFAAITLIALVSAQTTTPTTTTTTATTLNTSTCSPRSIAACPTPYDPCCAFVCAEAQVPFQVCSPNNETFLASCYACAPPTTTATATATPTFTLTTTPPPSVVERRQACSTGYSATGCPAVPDPCCAWLCGEAQVPFALCSYRDGTGQFETCSRCPTAAPRL